jgi:DNA-binding transcriptional LysR family regulator
MFYRKNRSAVAATVTVTEAEAMSMSLRAMRYFCAVGELGSISAAVQSLNVSQAAITESVQALETHLDVLLFRRHARGMALTHAGHEFLRHAHRILDAVAVAEEALSVRPEALAGELVIGAVSLLTGYYLPSLLARYRRAFPNVKTWVYEDAGTFIEQQLINGELDAALMITSTLENASSFDTTALIRSPWRLWVPARHRLAGAQQVSMMELRGEPVVELRSDELKRGAGDLWLRAGFNPMVAVRTRSVEATRSLVATGCGVSILPEVLFRAWSLDGEQLVAVPLADAPSPLAIGVVWRRGAPVSAATEAFLAASHEHGVGANLRRVQPGIVTEDVTEVS